MSAPAKLAGFAATLAVVFGGAALAGGAVDADPPGGKADPTAEMAGMAGEAGAHGAVKPVRGLAVAENGLRLAVQDTELRRGATERLRFRILDEDGRAVRDFDLEHEKRMHVIVVRRDTQGFQHLHPTMERDGTWSLPLRLEEAGSYRLFADFARDEEDFTLAAELRVDGPVTLADLPAPAPAAVTDGGYEVRLTTGDTQPGEPAELRFAISKDGRTITTEPYLGAGGHLVALREGDLAFLHVHPEEHAERDASIGFEATFPTTGRYRLFLQFQHEGRIQTAAFTQEVK